MEHKPPCISFLQKIFPLIVVIIMLPGLMASCTSQQDSIFEGHYSTSFEASVFYPCGSEYIEGVGYKDLGYWLESGADSGFNEQLKTFHSQRGPTGELNVYVKIVAKRSPAKQNGYGHLGLYSNQITVIEVIDMKPWLDTLCP